jgi:hypothetical protein
LKPPVLRTALFAVAALLCFAGNSLLCRLALAERRIDAASFTALRLASGAAMLGCCWQVAEASARPSSASAA